MSVFIKGSNNRDLWGDELVPHLDCGSGHMNLHTE